MSSIFSIWLIQKLLDILHLKASFDFYVFPICQALNNCLYVMNRMCND